MASVLFLVPFYVLAQSTQIDSTAVKRFKQIDIGGSFGSIFNEVNFDPHQTECGTSYSSQYFKHIYSVGGVGFSQITEKNKSRTTLGVNVHAGTIKTTSLETNEEESTFTYGINPYARIDSKWIGAGIGFQVGDLRKISNETIEASEVSDAQKSHVILPEFHFRVGPRHILDAEYNYGFFIPFTISNIKAKYKCW